MSTELGTAYVTVMPSMSKFGSALFKGVGKASVDGGKASAASFGQGLIGGIKGIGIGTAVGNLISSAAGMIASSVGSAVSRVDQLANFPKVMQNLGYGADEATAAIGRMSAGIDGLPTSLDGIASATTKIAPLTGSLGKATEVSLALNNALLAGGKDAQTQANALEQFSQMLAVGKVDMAAWRSMVSAMPGQLDQLSVALLGAGHKNMDLYEAMKAGTVTFDQFNDALLDLNANGVAGFASFEQQARTSTQGIGTAVENAKNRVSKALALVIDEIGQGTIADAINGVTSRFGDMASFVVDGIRGIRTSIDTSRIARSFEGIADSVAGISGHLMGAFTRIGSTIGDMATRVGVAVGGFATAFSGQLPGIIEKLAPLVENVVQLMGDRLAVAFDVATQLVGPFAAALGTVLDVASALVGALDEVYVYVGDYITETLGNVDFSPLYDALDGISSMVGSVDLTPLTDGLYDALDAWGGLVSGIDATPLLDALARVTGSVASVDFSVPLGAIGGALSDAMTWLERFANAVMPVGGAVVNLAEKVGTVLGKAFVELMELASPVVSALGDLALATLPAIQGAIEAVGGVLEWFGGVIEPLVSVVAGIAAAFAGMQAVGAVVAAVTGVASAIGGAVATVTAIVGSIQSVAGLGAVLTTLAGGPVALVVGAIAGLVAGIAVLWNTNEDFRNGVTECWESICAAVSSALDVIGERVQGVVQAAEPVLSAFFAYVGDTIVPAFIAAWQTISTVVEGVFGAIVPLVGGALGAMEGIFITAMAVINGDWEGAWEGIKSIGVSIWNGMTSAARSIFNGLKATLASILNAVKANVTNVFNGIKTTATNVWNGIKGAIETPINAAKDAVRGAINAIKGFFNFKFQWPHIPLPHFSISGSVNPLDWLTQGVPSISVEWYAKGGIVNGATLIGAGERGPELITPLTNPHMRGYAESIGKFVASTLGGPNDGSAALLAEVRALRSDLARLRLSVGTRELAMAMADDMDRALGRRAALGGMA